MTSTIKVDTISENTSAGGVTIDGVLVKDNTVDVNGTSDGIILDADADTTISADTDDQIDFKAGGTDIMSLTATTATFNDGVEITVADNSDNLTLTSTDADASSGPNLRFYRNSSSPADGDDLSTIDFEGRNDNSQDVVYAQIKGLITDASDGTEDGKLELYHMFGGSLAPSLQLTTAGIVINESSNDIDFRIESNGNENILFVDGGNDRVIIGGQNASFGVLGVENAGDATVDLFSNVGSGTEGKAEIFLSTDTSSDHVSVASIVMQQDGAGDRKGDITFNTSDNGGPSARMFISNSGEVIIGSTSNSTPATSSTATHSAFQAGGILSLSANGTPCLRVNRVNSEGLAVELRQAGGLRGSISVAGATAAFNTSSDYRLKENVSYDWDATTRLKQLKPARFNWISDDTNTLVDGFLAHEAQTVVPESVNGEKDAMSKIFYTSDDAETQGDNPTKNVGDFKEYSTTEIDPQQIDQSKLVPLMVKTIQELEARIKTLEDA